VDADRLTLITGGASSGKTSHASRLAATHGERVLYIATCEPRDPGLMAKVERHRASRPAHWTTLERSRSVAKGLTSGFDAAIVDCLTLMIAQQLVGGSGEVEILGEIAELGAARPGYPVYVVTNEVGMGVVPAGQLSRAFAELQGRANQQLARRADTVLCMIAGLPLTLKGPRGPEGACPSF
jgi:adenosylcobinamide kinase/adenosylcobinamide-phosphate guanylyltransferase